MNLILLTTS